MTAVEPDELEQFRKRVRDWLEQHLPAVVAAVDGDEPTSWSAPSPASPEEELAAVARAKKFQRALFEAGLAGLTWPVDYGGQGLTLAHQIAFTEELARSDSPLGHVFTVTFGMCGPTILTHGTEEQRRRYIPPMLRGEEIWCQLFSEPGAGSDVAGLQSRAVHDGDEWVLNGQKVWTSGGHYARFGLAIARTDPDLPKHKGITMFIVDMQSPGVTAHPLRQMTGEAHFNEVFFDDVRIPAENLVGELNDGWRPAITTLMNERVSIGAGSRPAVTEPLRRLARRQGRQREALVPQRLAEVWIAERVLELIGQRIRQAAMSGAVPGPEGSIAKLASARLGKQAASLAAELLGAGATAWREGDDDALAAVQQVLAAPGSSIAGGTDEVQKNIVGERVLGLPKEPAVDRDMPFRDIPTPSTAASVG